MYRLPTLCFLVCALAFTAAPARCATIITPSYFSLPRTAFPRPTSVLRSHVEPNGRIARDNVLHFGTRFAREGRLTGYFMDTLEGRRTAPRSDTSYLVSVFGALQQATSAFQEQRYYWDALTVHGGSSEMSLPDGAYGDPGAEALYVVRLPTGSSLAELLFRRGPIFIEVFQEVYAAHPSGAEVRAFFTIGTRLDVIARGVLGA